MKRATVFIALLVSMVSCGTPQSMLPTDARRIATNVIGDSISIQVVRIENSTELFYYDSLVTSSYNGVELYRLTNDNYYTKY